MTNKSVNLSSALCSLQNLVY